MDDDDFEGSLVLEKLAALNLLDSFWEAVDADDFKAASRLMKLAHIDGETIAVVLRKMADTDGTH